MCVCVCVDYPPSVSTGGAETTERRRVIPQRRSTRHALRLSRRAIAGVCGPAGTFV